MWGSSALFVRSHKRTVTVNCGTNNNFKKDETDRICSLLLPTMLHWPDWCYAMLSVQQKQQILGPSKKPFKNMFSVQGIVRRASSSNNIRTNSLMSDCILQADRYSAGQSFHRHFNSRWVSCLFSKQHLGVCDLRPSISLKVTTVITATRSNTEANLMKTWIACPGSVSQYIS